MIHYSSTSYLGMNFHPEFKTFLIEGFEKYGTNYGGSRLANNVPDIYNLAEHHLASNLDFEDALIVSSGTLAGHLLLTAIPKNQDFFHFKLLHPALLSQFIGKKSTEVQDYEDLMEQIYLSSNEHICILLNSIHPVLVEKTPVQWIHELPKNKKITVIIDDSHGIGMIGKNGKGIMSELEKYPDYIEIILLASLGKAIGVPAGVILGKTIFINKIKALPIWGGGSPTPPAYLYAFLKSVSLRHHQRQKLQENIDCFATNLARLSDFTFIQQFPVFKYKGDGLYDKLIQKGMAISKISYPTRLDTPTERIVLNSLHAVEDIYCILDVVSSL